MQKMSKLKCQFCASTVDTVLFKKCTLLKRSKTSGMWYYEIGLSEAYPAAAWASDGAPREVKTRLRTRASPACAQVALD